MEDSIPKGTFDILPKDSELWRESHRWRFLEEKLLAAALRYGFEEIRTPIFERTELFVRSVGETSDIVTKEMYTFEDKGGRSLTLRPEGTAPVVRALCEKHLCAHRPDVKLFYMGPMFRYERPQAGRFRQHHQFGIESIGIPHPHADVEIIALLYDTFSELGIKGLEVGLNSVGDAVTRTRFKEALLKFLTPHLNNLSPESQARFTKNPLRILDSKDPRDQEVLQKAPSILDALEGETLEHFETVQRLLKELKIPFRLQPRLVRGLDYYTRTVFEITSSALGAQNSICGGGRYDGLIASLGGPDLPAVGAALGFERLLQVLLKENAPFPPPPHPHAFLVPLGDAAVDKVLPLLYQLRRAQISAEADFSGKRIQHGLQKAEGRAATFAVILGEDELKSNSATVKEMATRESHKVALSDLVSFLKSKL